MKAMEANKVVTMRDVLEFADSELRRVIEDDSKNLVLLDSCMRCVADVCHAALSKSPRNCDRFTNEVEARKAFIVWYNTTYELNGDKQNKVSSCDLKHNVDGILHDYIEWLFATATEQKESLTDEDRVY